MTPSLTEQQIEIFKEIAETGIMHSLNALTKLSKHSWCTLPNKFNFYSFEQYSAMFQTDEPKFFGGNLFWDGETPMSLLCIFPQSSNMNLAHYMLAGNKLKTSEIASYQMLTTAEVSNILVNAFLNVIANTLQEYILPTPPEVTVGPRKLLLEKAALPHGTRPDNVIVAELNMESDQIAVSGYMCFIASTQSLQKLINKVQSSPAWSKFGGNVF